MTEQKVISIDPRVALSEVRELVEYYRNRNLALAQTLFEREQQIEELEAKIVELQPPAATEAAEAKKPVQKVVKPTGDPPTSEPPQSAGGA